MFFCFYCSNLTIGYNFIFVSDMQYYVPVKLCKSAGSIHLFKTTGTIKPENVKVNQNYIWDTIEVD